MISKRIRAFTLIELLTVIAITAVLLTLIIVPLFQTFNMTRSALGFSDAQHRARLLVERISREVGNGAAVRDNTGLRGAIALDVPARPVNLGGPGGVATVILPFMKLDVVKPAEGDPLRGPSGALVDPNTGREDPTLRAPKGQIVLPVTPGATLVRYMVALKDPFRDYANPYDGLLMARIGGVDNLFVLYRVEIQPFVYQNDGSYVPNTELFEVDGNGQIVIDDPAFMLPNRAGGAIVTNDAKAARIRAWLRRATLLTELSRYDMIQPVFDRRTREVVYDGDAPRLIPLVQFKPTRVSNEAAEGMQAVRQGEETEGAERIAPDVFRTERGGWTNALIRLWPQGWTPGSPYLVARTGADVPGFSVFAYDPSGPGTEETGGVELFDVSGYENSVAAGLRYPFVIGVQAAHNRSGWLGSSSLRNLFAPLFTDSAAGKVYASFGIHEVGNPAQNPPLGNPMNLPSAPTGPELTPQNDPDLAGGTFSDPEYATLNRKFNKVWFDYPQLRPDIHRFVDLRVTPGADGTDSPLHPEPTRGFARASIVPGSEEVFGPDQVAGANYGQYVRYTRTTRAPGPNQYRINYVDQNEPDNYGLLGLNNPPPTYTATNFESAVIQPRYKAGYIQLNSDPNVPLPLGEIRVSYRFQFTRPRDAVTVDYDSRQVMSILLTIRNHPQTSLPNPQSVTLTSTATVRNYLR
jgi:prepilin-type N-terminal cleavage/methylation domain-containing protein